MSERNAFLEWVNTRLRDAEEALHDGDAAPRLEIWSGNDPVTVSGRGSRPPDSRSCASSSGLGGHVLGLQVVEARESSPLT